MSAEVSRRDDLRFPPVWLSLAVPDIRSGDEWLDELVQTAQEAKTVIDISSQPALWGGKMRGTDALLMSKGGLEIERATNALHALDLIQALLIQTLSSIGREYIDIFFLIVQNPLADHQIKGVIEGLQMLGSEKHIRHLGLMSTGAPTAIIDIWKEHDIFDLLLVKDANESRQQLLPLAKERQVQIVRIAADPNPSHESGPILKCVRTPDEVRKATSSLAIRGEI